MKKAITLILATFCMLTVFSQSDTIIVNLKDKKAFKKIPVEDGLIKVGKLDGEMVLSFPATDNFLKYSVQFKDDKGKSFYISFNCSGDSCIQIYLDDMSKNELKLSFRNNALTGIGNRIIKERKLPAADSPYIKILSEEPRKTDDMYAVLKTDKQPKDLVADKAGIDTIKFYCGTLVCKTCDPKDITIKSHFKHDKVADMYQQVFEKPATFYDKITGNKVSAKYWIINDIRDGKKPITTYLRRKGNSDEAIWVVRKRLTPVSGKQMVYTIIGPADSSYVIDTVQMQGFLEDGDQLKKLVTETIPSGINGGTDTATQESDKIDSLKTVIAKLESAMAAIKKTPIDQYQKEIDQLKDSIKNLQTKIDSLISVIYAKVKPATVNLKEKFLALERDLEKFNGEYDDISFKKDEYKADLLCLQLKIKEILQIPVSGNAKEDFAQSLINLVLGAVKDEGYYKEFSNLIKAIEAAYGQAVSKKPTYGLFSASRKVANVDEFEAKIKTANGKDYFYRETFSTSIGLKIDFSTGVFLNGLRNHDFILAEHPYRYKDADGSVKETKGSLIQRNDPKMSYSAGFLTHVYPRTGELVNVGLATGLTINNSNSSPIQLMLGGSVMFKAGKNRVSLVGGITWGQIKEISSVARDFEWDKTNDPDNKQYESIYDVPRFYTSSSDIPTFDKWKRSWVFGITYNFASLSLGK